MSSKKCLLANECINELIEGFGDYNPEKMKEITGKYQDLFDELEKETKEENEN